MDNNYNENNNENNNYRTYIDNNEINMESNPENYENQNFYQNNDLKTDQKKEEVPRYQIITCRIIAITLIVIAIVISVRAIVYKKYDICGCRFYMIMSGSMEDTIKIGDGVISKSTKNLKEGDIIAFKMDNQTTVHRITKIYTEGNKKLYKTKGDNNNAEDRGITKEEDIQGKIIIKLPKIGTAILFLQRNIIMVLILIIGSIVIIWVAKKLYKNIKG